MLMALKIQMSANPSFDKYLKKLRWEIWNKFGNRCFTDFEYLIMDGLHYEEYTLFKKIINIIKKSNNDEQLRNELKKIGQQLYQHRQRESLTIAHYSFHGYIHILLGKHKDMFSEREINELVGSSLMLEHCFSGIGDWVP